MAFKIQPPPLVGTFEYISVLDDAIDSDAEDFEDKWKQYREGKVDPPLKKGASKPTVWTLDPVHSPRLKANLNGVLSEHGNQAFLVALAAVSFESVDGLSDAKGKPYRLEFSNVDGYQVLCDRQLAELGFEFLVEVGLAVHQHNSPS